MTKNDDILEEYEDWFSDPNVSQLRLASRAVWREAIMRMQQLDGTGRLSGQVEVLARLCRCTSGDLLACISDLILRNAADITADDRYTVTRESSGRLVANGIQVNDKRDITLVNRRMHRKYLGRISTRNRQRSFLARQTNGDITDDITPDITGEVTPRKTRAPYYSPPNRDSLEIPENLRTEEFFCAWEILIKHKKQKRHPLTESSVKLLLKKLSKWGPERAVSAIEWSVENNWTGVFENDSPHKKNGVAHESASDRRKRELNEALEKS